MTKQSNVTPKAKEYDQLGMHIRKMPQQMRMFGFPCGETNCEEIAGGELIFFNPNMPIEFKIPICKTHAMMLTIELD